VGSIGSVVCVGSSWSGEKRRWVVEGKGCFGLVRRNGRIVLNAELSEVLDKWFEVLITEAFETNEIIYNRKWEVSWNIPPQDDERGTVSVNVGG
jgi:hypothetical protein